MRAQVADAPAVDSGQVAALQLVYCVLTGGFPFNSFLGGFFSCLGMAVTTGEPAASSPHPTAQQSAMYFPGSEDNRRPRKA
jgi:hypothetical protein